LHQADHAIPPLPFCLTCRPQLYLNALTLANRELQKVLTKRVEATLAVEFIVDFSCQSGIGQFYQPGTTRLLQVGQQRVGHRRPCFRERLSTHGKNGYEQPEGDEELSLHNV
jgi:hypothetical protein